MFFFLTETACFAPKKSFVAFARCGFALCGRFCFVWAVVSCGGMAGLVLRVVWLGLARCVPWFAKGMVWLCERYGFVVQKVTFWRAKGMVLESRLFSVAARMTGGACSMWLLGCASGALATQEAGRCAGLCTRPASLKLLLFNCLLAAVGSHPWPLRGGGCALLAGSLGAFALRWGYFLTTFTVRPLLIRTMFSPFCGPAMARPSAL